MFFGAYKDNGSYIVVKESINEIYFLSMCCNSKFEYIFDTNKFKNIDEVVICLMKKYGVKHAFGGFGTHSIVNKDEGEIRYCQRKINFALYSKNYCDDINIINYFPFLKYNMKIKIS